MEITKVAIVSPLRKGRFYRDPQNVAKSSLSTALASQCTQASLCRAKRKDNDQGLSVGTDEPRV